MFTNMPGLGTIARQRSQPQLDYTGKLRVWWHRDGNRTYWYVRTYTSGLEYSSGSDIYIPMYIDMCHTETTSCGAFVTASFVLRLP